MNRKEVFSNPLLKKANTAIEFTEDQIIEFLTKKVLPNYDFAMVQTVARSRSPQSDMWYEVNMSYSAHYRKYRTSKNTFTLRTTDSGTMFTGQGLMALNAIYLAKNNEVEKKWKLIDADGLILGRLAVNAANILRGRDKPTYTPHVDTGDFLIIVNAEKVKLTGAKESGKLYQDYTGYMGGLKTKTASEIRAKNPTRLIRDAVKGMMPKKLNVVSSFLPVSILSI